MDVEDERPLTRGSGIPSVPVAIPQQRSAVSSGPCWFLLVSLERPERSCPQPNGYHDR
jgi:hypothetical protein